MSASCCQPVLSVIRSVTVEPVLFLFMFASSLTFSAFLAVTYDKSCLLLHNATFCDELNNDTFAKGHKHEEDLVQQESSAWIMRGNIAITVPATLCLLLWLGSLGDRVGRRAPLVVPCVAAIVYSVSNIVNAAFLSWSPALMLPGQVVSGLGGSYLAVLMACYTYLTHLSEESGTGMARVGVAEGAVFLSSTVSVVVAGRMVDVLGYVPVFGVALACQVLALGYTVFLLPNIKARERTQSDTGSNSCCLSSARDMWTFFTTARAARVKVHLVLFIVVLDILQLCTTGEGDILLLYLKRSPRSWSYTTYGYFKGSENFTRGAAVLLLLPLFKKKTSVRDTTLILAGLVSKMAALVLLGLAKETWAIFLVVGVACLQGFPSAGLRSLMASLVETEEQGRLFGVVAATESVVTFVSTLVFNGLYPLTLDLYDGLCFQLAAGLVFLCVIVIVCQHIDLTRRDMTLTRNLQIDDVIATSRDHIMSNTNAGSSAACR
ncbi:proton-coupled folate transporter-like [Littorina saxatilis]